MAILDRRLAGDGLATGLLAGCYAYPAGYAPYNAYPVAGGYQGDPYYGGYAGGIFVEQGGFGRGRPRYFRDDGRDDNDRGFHGHAGGGFNHPDGRPGGFGGTVHGGGDFHAGDGGFFSHH